jgi:hypothetical protein
MKTKSEAEKHRIQCRNWRNAKKKNPGFCDCGKPAIKIKFGSEPVCSRCDELESKGMIVCGL